MDSEIKKKKKLDGLDLGPVLVMSRKVYFLLNQIFRDIYKALNIDYL